MNPRFIYYPAVFVAALLAGCGGGASEVSENGISNPVTTVPAVIPEQGAAIDASNTLDIDSQNSEDVNDVSATEPAPAELEQITDAVDSVTADIESQNSETVSDIVVADLTPAESEQVVGGVDSDTPNSETQNTTNTVDYTQSSNESSTQDSSSEVIPINESGIDNTDDDEPSTALEIVQEHESLGIFLTALQSTNYMQLLSDPHQRITVYAPSDAAFSMLSQKQIEALLNDSDRIDEFLRRHTAIESRTTMPGASLDSWSAHVEETHTTANTAVHIIDGFMMPYFPPDEGTVLDVLSGEAGYSTFYNEVRGFHSLGNSELNWIVLALDNDNMDNIGVQRFNASDHIIGTTNNPGISILAGEKQADSGVTLNFEGNDSNLMVNGSKIHELDAFSVSNGSIHLLNYPATWESGTGETMLERLDRLAEQPNPKWYSSGYEDRAVQEARASYRFFAELIRVTGTEAMFSSIEHPVSLIVPRYPLPIDISQPREDRQLISDEQIITTYFPDVDAAREYLLSHAVSGFITNTDLQARGGEIVTTLDGKQSLEIAEIFLDNDGQRDTEYAYSHGFGIGGQPVVTIHMAQTGSIIPLQNSLIDISAF